MDRQAPNESSPALTRAIGGVPYPAAVRRWSSSVLPAAAARVVEPAQRLGQTPAEPARELIEPVLQGRDLGVEPGRARVGDRPGRLALGLGAPGAGPPVGLVAALVPLVGHADVGLDPEVQLLLLDHLERVVVDRAEVGGHDLAAGGSHLA